MSDSRCLECDLPAVWERHTQFAGIHPFCDEHARKESDFNKSDDCTFWQKIGDSMQAESGEKQRTEPAPIPMLIYCPMCKARHIDEGEFATKSHHTHACQTCGHVWRPAVVATVGVQFLPGFKNGA